MTTATLEHANQTQAFAEKMVGIANSSALGLMISIGHRTGLFDAMSTLAPSTSDEIARAAGLNERYVREWLGAMTVGGITECTGADKRFSLPPEHAASLTRAAGRDNIAVIMQFFPVLGRVEDEVVECFKNGGGVPYSSYPRFHEVMAEESGGTVISGLRDHILPLVPGLIADLERGIDVLDVGCGSGRAMVHFAQLYPKSRFTGFDLSPQAISNARAQAAELGLKNLRFEIRDLSHFDTEAPVQAFDLITAFDAIHDQARPDRVLAGIARALTPDGTFLMQDIAGSSHVHFNMDHPIGPVIYTISCMHCMTVSLAQGGMGLGAAWGRETATDMLRTAGFMNVDVRDLPHDFQNHYYVCRK